MTSLAQTEVSMEDKQTNKRERSDPDAELPTNVKKKKESHDDSSFFGTEDEDILVSGWFYLDVDGVQQGPFTSKEMKEWLVMGFFSQTTRVKRVTAPEFQTIADSEDFKTNVEQKQLEAPPRKPDLEEPDSEFHQDTTESETPHPSSYPLPGGPSEEASGETVDTSDKLAWQQYQEYQQFQYFMYLQYCQQEQEKERKRQEQELAKQNQIQNEELQRVQQRMLEEHIEKEKSDAVNLLEKANYLSLHHFDAYGDAPPLEDADPEPQSDIPAAPPSHMDPGTYAQQAFFNTTNGRFTAETPEQFWRGKNIPTDREGRMMAHYFDVEAYQRQMREAAANPTKRPKVTKKMIKSYKKKKVDKQRNRILMM